MTLDTWKLFVEGTSSSSLWMKEDADAAWEVCVWTGDHIGNCMNTTMLEGR